MSARSFIPAILERAINAPSGDNSQPWRFKIEGATVSIFNVPESDPTLYNFRQRGSYIAHGALVENIVILSMGAGFHAKVEPFPEIPDCTARISLSERETIIDPLEAAIGKRATNRKPYKKGSLESPHRAALEASIQESAGVRLKLMESPQELEILAQAISLNELLIMENRRLHDLLFGMIRWSSAHERRAPGLYLKTMEFPLPVQILFRTLLRFWFCVRLLNVFGLSKSIPKQSAPIYRSSSAIGALILENDRDESFLSAGRAFQRLWLTATSLGVSLQPVTAIPYLMQRVEAGEAQAFSPKHTEMIRAAYGKITKTFGLVGEEHIAMLFRVGYGDAPSARSSKLPPVIL